MTAEQLEKLLGKVTPDWCVYSEIDVGLMPSLFAGQIGVTGFGPLEPLKGYDLMLAALAPYLARRVIAAEKLSEAASNAVMYLESGFINCGKCGDEVETKHTDAEYELRQALTAYREASK